MTKLTVVGATTWGTTLAINAAREGSDTRILVRSQKEATTLNSNRENTRFLPGVKIPETAIATDSLDNAFDRPDIVLFAVPSHSLRQNAKTVANKIDSEAIIVSAVKGLEVGSGKRMSEILAEELPNLDILEQELVFIPVGWWLSDEDKRKIVKNIKSFSYF